MFLIANCLCLTCVAIQGAVPAADSGSKPEFRGAGFAPHAHARSAPQIQRGPLTFVANEGQWDSPALFVAQQGSLAIGIERDALAICAGDSESGDAVTNARLVFEGAREDVAIEGSERASGRRSFSIGNNPARWRDDVPAFARVAYHSLYVGVDLLLHESDGLPEYDFVLAPGANLEQIRVRCDGIEAICLDAEGELVLDTPAGPLHQAPPKTWYELPSGERREVACRFELTGERSYGFRIDARDASLPLVVDPGLVWSTYYGRHGNEETPASCVDPLGRIVLAGRTTGNVPGAGSSGGGTHGFVAMLDPTQPPSSQLVWAKYIGGSAIDMLFGGATDSFGNIYLTGATTSANFPTTAGAYSTSPSGSMDAVVLELDPSGAIVYSSFFGGNSVDWGTDIRVQAPNSVTIAGVTYSGAPSFPTTSGAFQPSIGGSSDHFVARFALSVSGAAGLVYSTYLGGNDIEGGSVNFATPWEMDYQGLALDGAGDVYICGFTLSANFPVTASAYQHAITPNGSGDCFVTHIRPHGAGAADLVYSTYLGGNSGEGAVSIVVDAAGVISVGGYTYSSDFPSTPGSFNPTFIGPAGYNDAFIARLDPSRVPASQLLYSTFFSGTGWEAVYGLISDGAGGLIACGFTGGNAVLANTFPSTCNALQPACASLLQDAFVLRLDPSGNGPADLVYSTYLGGATAADGFGHVSVVGYGPTLRLVATGYTGSTDFPTVNAYQSTFGYGATTGYPDDCVACIIDIPARPTNYCVAGTSTNSCTPSMSACGAPSASATSGFTLSCSGLEGQTNGIIFFGANGRSAWPWAAASTSTLCVNGPQQRTPVQNSGGTAGACDGSITLDWLAFMAANPSALGNPLAAGETIDAQCWYRDPPAPKTTNLSDALEFVLMP